MHHQSLSPDKKAVAIVRILSTWKRSKRKHLSLDADTFSRYFKYLKIEHTVKDSKTQDIVFVVVDRESAIKAVEEKEQLHGTLICGDK